MRNSYILRKKNSFFSILLVFGIVSFASQTVQACSCAEFPSTFCESIDGDEKIVKVEVISQYYVLIQDGWYAPVMDVVLLEQYMGNTISQDTISILGQDGLNCNQPVEGFQVNEKLLLALPFDVNKIG